MGRSQKCWETSYTVWTALRSPTAKKYPAQTPMMLRLRKHNLGKSGTLSEIFWVFYSNIYWILMIYWHIKMNAVLVFLKRLVEARSPEVPSVLPPERQKTSSVNYWSETRLPSNICQKIVCPLAPPWNCDGAAGAVSGFTCCMFLCSFYWWHQAQQIWWEESVPNREGEGNWQSKGWIWDVILSQATLRNTYISSGLRSSH